MRTKQDEDIPTAAINQDKVAQVITQIIELFGSKELPSYCAKMIIDAPEKPSSNWSLGNQLLMLFHGTQDARGFQQWKEVNRFVKKGAEAFYILGPIIVHYVFNTCPTMLDTAFLGQPRYRHRDVNEIILICMIGVALLTIAATRGKLGQGRSD